MLMFKFIKSNFLNFKILKKLPIFIFALFLLLCTGTQAEDLSTQARISIITCDPGRELYSVFGHTAIEVKVHQDQNWSRLGALPGSKWKNTDVHVTKLNGTCHRPRLPLSRHEEAARKSSCAMRNLQDPCPRGP